MRVRLTSVAPVLAGLLSVVPLVNCGGDDDVASPTGLDASSTADGSDATPADHVLPGAGGGATIALSPDDRRLVVTNRDTGTISVFAVEYPTGAPPTITRTAEVSVCAEPWQVAIHPDGDTAFVVCRKDQKVARIKGLAGVPSKDGEVAVGSEPTGLALTPLGKTLWVANFVDGTLSGIDTTTLTVKTTLDLNASLVGTGLLGAGVAARPGIAHPRSVAVSNNGDMSEDDEFIYATEYFAQTTAPVAADGSNADTSKAGLLYKISVLDKSVKTIQLPPITDLGFKDHKGGTQGCFPNQISSFQVNGAFGYALSVCASPKGPAGVFTKPFASCVTNGDVDCPGAVAGSCGATTAGVCAVNCVVAADCGVGGVCNPTTHVCAPNPQNVKSLTHPAVTIVDLGGNKSIATVSLTKSFFDFYETAGTPDTSDRRYPLLANEISFIPGTVDSYVSAGGADAVFHIKFDGTYANGATIDSVGAPGTGFIDLAPATPDPLQAGRMPTGIVLAKKQYPDAGAPRYAFVTNEATRNVSVVDLAANKLAGLSTNSPVVKASTALPTVAGEQAVLEGKRLFNTGLGRWSLNGQAWGACSECHQDGLTDNVTWYFPRGARQSPSLDGSFSKKSDRQRALAWSANLDEGTDFETSIIRAQLGGVGLIVKDPALSATNRIDIDTLGHGGLAGSSAAAADPANPAGLAAPSVLDDWKKVVAYMKSVRSPSRPIGLDAAKIAAGKALFVGANCQGCHGGEQWTTSRVFYAPDPLKALNVSLKSTSYSSAVATLPAGILPSQTPANQVMRYNGSNAAAFDSLWCNLRSVGTFGVAEAEQGVAELRQDMVTPSQGNEADGKGFNPPSLLGGQLGAPYFHAGNARTLEAAFADTFKGHHQALSPGFLDAADPQRGVKVAQLVQYIMSIDGSADAVAIPTLGPTGGDFCAKP